MDEPQTGAIRMLAFGVLEHQPRSVVVGETFPIGKDPDVFKRLAEREQRTLEIEVMVVGEFNGLGWRLAHKARPSSNQFILLGAMGGTKAMPVRPKIGEGSLQDVCRAAVDWLDNGPQPGAHQPTGALTVTIK